MRVAAAVRAHTGMRERGLTCGKVLRKPRAGLHAGQEEVGAGPGE